MRCKLGLLGQYPIIIRIYIIHHREVMGILDSEAFIIVVGGLRHVRAFIPFLADLLRHGVDRNAAQPVADTVGNSLDAGIILNLLGSHTIIWIFGTALGSTGIVQHHLVRVKFNPLCLHILMVNLALCILHLAGFLAPVVLSLVAVQDNPGLGIRQLQHIGLVFHLHILGGKVAICMFRNKPPLVQGGHHHISLHHKITGILIIKELVPLHGYRHILGGIQGLPQIFLHFVGIQQKLLLILIQCILPGITPTVFHIVQNSRIRITFTIIPCFCLRQILCNTAGSKGNCHDQPGSQPANFFFIL